MSHHGHIRASWRIKKDLSLKRWAKLREIVTMSESTSIHDF